MLFYDLFKKKCLVYNVGTIGSEIIIPNSGINSELSWQTEIIEFESYPWAAQQLRSDFKNLMKLTWRIKCAR